MKYPHFFTSALLVVLAVTVLGACDPKQDDTGVVARVNGRPISLHQLQLKHDFDHLGLAADNPTVNRLKGEYGAALTDLLVRELVFQALETRGLTVTDDEVAVAEVDIRKDYPEESFEEVLVEEYIDINYWRDELRARLSVEKFFDEVLRPGISIDYREAEEYYREHIQDFYMPKRVRLFRITGPSREVLENAIDFYKKGGELNVVGEKFDQVVVRDITMREDRMTKNWRDAVKGLAPGESSGVMASLEGFEALLFAENIPARVLAASLAYPAIERELVDRKLMEAFNVWLEKRMAEANIVVTPLLEVDLEHEAPAQELPEAPIPAEEGAPVQDDAGAVEEAPAQ